MKKKRKPRTAIIREFRSPVGLIVVLSCFSLLTISVNGQGRRPPGPKTALIFGTVWGPDDHALPGVTVKIRKAGEKKARWEVRSNRRGEFEQEIPSGQQDYVIWADVKGYKLLDGSHLQPSPEVTVHIESNERADTGLHLK